MKKVLLVILLVLFTITGCSSSSSSSAISLKDIVEKINNSETVKNYKDYGFNIEATSTDDTLTVTSQVDESSSKVEFTLKDTILSNENISTENLILALLVVDGVGQVEGYKDGELSQNMNSFSDEYKNYTLDKEGLEFTTNDDTVSIKIDLSKKIPLIDMSSFYLKTTDLDMIAELVKEKEPGNQNGKLGNIAYDIFVGEDTSTITIGQDDQLSDSAYKSILSALEVMYGKDTAKKFEELYPEFVDGTKTVEAFTIEKDYKPDDQDNSVFKDTEVVLVTIDNNELK